MEAIKLTFFILLISACSVFSEIYSKGSTDEWNYLLFVQEWPPTRCEISVRRGLWREACEIPPYVSGWTIHGLWPEDTCNKYPSYCNNSWPFDEKKILKKEVTSILPQVHHGLGKRFVLAFLTNLQYTWEVAGYILILMGLEPQLKLVWPNLFPNEKKTSFWKHEWDKHGTCSTNLPALDSEFKYFNVTLNFHKLFSFSSALERAGIKPSYTISYQVKDFQKAVQSMYGVVPHPDCVFKGEKQLLLQMFLCINKSLEKMDCNCPSTSCRDDQAVYFHPYP